MTARFLMAAHGERPLPIPENDLIPDLRQLTELDIRELVRGHALELTVLLYWPIQRGEAQRDPKKFAMKALGENQCLQRCIVGRGSRLSDTEISRLAPQALIQATAEVIDFMCAVTSEEYLGQIVVEELRTFLPFPAQAR